MSSTDLLTLDELLGEIRSARSTWEKWRARRLGPSVIRLPNGKLRIRRADLDAWLEGQAA
jgi:hypothetical protein